MTGTVRRDRQGDDETALLLRILEGTSHETGEAFFRALVRSLAEALGTHGAWVTDYLPDAGRLRARAFWLGDQWVPHYEYAIAGTPCEPVVAQCRLLHIPDRVVELFPGDPDLKAVGALSYTGMPLTGRDGRVIGHLAVLDTKPQREEPRYHAILQIFGARAAAELRRLRAEAAVREREQRLGRLIDGAMDGIVDFDDRLTIRLMNAAAGRTFATDAGGARGSSLDAFLAQASIQKLRRFMESFDALPEDERRAWVTGGLQGRRSDGGTVEIEATLSEGVARGRRFYTLILRDVNERLEAERAIRRLEAETAYLRTELEALQDTGEIIGRSEPVRRALRAVEQVAETDATVLVLGERGTGKELFARAIHNASRRRDKPLITVNCAAIPADLVESEFFGHEKGAFTGATARREGRFALAHNATIFLDEIGELPPALQAKLLRVLQEGEFTPVGSSTTRRVDVRVVAATNRNLADAVTRGEFREDLYYRLNVFPIEIPPLRQRGDDVRLLAGAFAERIARRLGRRVGPLSEEDVRALKAYSWPGNVRELQNIIERAVITAHHGRLNLQGVLPALEGGTGRTPEPAPPTATTAAVRTASELRELERNNILRALASSGWKVSGEYGAARRLGLKPSTLSSRMKALGIRRPTA